VIFLQILATSPATTGTKSLNRWICSLARGFNEVGTSFSSSSSSSCWHSPRRWFFGTTGAVIFAASSESTARVVGREHGLRLIEEYWLSEEEPPPLPDSIPAGLRIDLGPR
jgi:hypothetical protein